MGFHGHINRIQQKNSLEGASPQRADQLLPVAASLGVAASGPRPTRPQSAPASHNAVEIPTACAGLIASPAGLLLRRRSPKRAHQAVRGGQIRVNVGEILRVVDPITPPHLGQHPFEFQLVMHTATSTANRGLRAALSA